MLSLLARALERYLAGPIWKAVTDHDDQGALGSCTIEAARDVTLLAAAPDEDKHLVGCGLGGGTVAVFRHLADLAVAKPDDGASDGRHDHGR